METPPPGIEVWFTNVIKSGGKGDIASADLHSLPPCGGGHGQTRDDSEHVCLQWFRRLGKHGNFAMICSRINMGKLLNSP